MLNGLADLREEFQSLFEGQKVLVAIVGDADTSHNSITK